MIWHLIEVWLLMLAAFAIGAPLGAIAYDLIARTGLGDGQQRFADAIGNAMDAIRGRLGIGPVWRPEHLRMVEAAPVGPRVPFAPWRDETGDLDEDEDVQAIEAGAEPFDDGIEPMRPMTLPAPRNGAADDLQRIYGVGGRNARRLNALGIFHYGQIAAWTPAEMRWIALRMAFPERVEADDWVGQAVVLATGGDTGYAKAKRRFARPDAYDEDEDDEGRLMLPDAAVGFAIGSDSERLAAAVSDLAAREGRAVSDEDFMEVADAVAGQEVWVVAERDVAEAEEAEAEDLAALAEGDEATPLDGKIEDTADEEATAVAGDADVAEADEGTAPDAQAAALERQQTAEEAVFGADAVAETVSAEDESTGASPDVAADEVHAADIAESVRAAEDASEPKAEAGRLALPDASIGFFVAPNADVGPDDDDEPAQGRAAEGDTDNEIEKVAEPVASDPQADEAGSREAGAGDAAMTADDDAELVERSEDESGEAAHVDAEPDVEREQTPAVEGAGSDVVEAAKNEPAEAEVALSEAAADEAAEMVVAAAPPSDVPVQTAGAGEDQVGASEDAPKDNEQDAAASPDPVAAKEDGSARVESDEDKATRQDIEAG